MGQVTLARIAKDHLRDGGSITLTTGILAMHPMPGSASISLPLCQYRFEQKKFLAIPADFGAIART